MVATSDGIHLRSYEEQVKLRKKSARRQNDIVD